MTYDLPGHVHLFSATTSLSLALFGIIYVGPWMQMMIRKRRNARILSKLPSDLPSWRSPYSLGGDEETIWRDADEIMREVGLQQWPHTGDNVICVQSTPEGTSTTQNGYAYVTADRGVTVKGPGNTKSLEKFMYRNALNRAFRTADGSDVIVRVVAFRDRGQPQLVILRKLATGPQALLSNNHTLPMLREIQFEHITFATFPKVGQSLHNLYDPIWPKNSVGDLLDIIMQALEGLAYIHSMDVAHRDAFADNLLVQWQPESLRTMQISISRPRVYLIDFEVATSFEADSPSEKRLCIGYPSGSSLSNNEQYIRPRIPEMDSEEPYDPFKLDVWQLGMSFKLLKFNVKSVDNILEEMTAVDPAARLDANEALAKISSVVHRMSPLSLLIPPEFVEERSLF